MSTALAFSPRCLRRWRETGTGGDSDVGAEMVPKMLAREVRQRKASSRAEIESASVMWAPV